jgi:uncharacterized protein (DUF305 family)
MSGFPDRKTAFCLCQMLAGARASVLRLAGAVVWMNSSIFCAGAQNVNQAPAVVQPGAPGEPTKRLPADTHAILPPISRADVEFMQGMVMHHSQAVEMTALIPSRSENKDVRALGGKISSSQADEIRMMQRWLAARGQATSMEMPGPAGMPDMPGMDMSGNSMALMPGMLSPKQMEALRKARGTEFDRLFLSGMIQHHGGALVMVTDLFDSAGAGQDAEIFDFATDVDNSQRAEIKIMQKLLEELH